VGVGELKKRIFKRREKGQEGGGILMRGRLLRGG